MAQLFANNASALLVEDLLVSDTTVNLAPGDGNRFPLPDAGDPTSFAMLTLEDVNGNIEIVQMTERSGDILTIVRGQETTTPAGFGIGSRIEARLTAGSLDNFKQVADQYELRGDIIDTDGLRVWHQTDPSTYQFFRVRYYTNFLGVPAFEIEGPPGIDGVSSYQRLTMPDGSSRVVGFTFDYTGNAPYPNTGGTQLSVPGAIRWERIDNAFGALQMFGSFNYDTETLANTLKFKTNKTDPVAYWFVTRDEFEVEWDVKFKNDGSLQCANLLSVRNAKEATYTESKPFNIKYDISSTSPGDTDIVRFTRQNRTAGELRQLSYKFYTAYQTSADPVTYESREITINPNGTISVPTDPIASAHLATKGYVDNAISGGGSGTNLNSTAAALHGRTVLYSNAGLNPPQTNISLTTGSFSEYYEIEIVCEYVPDGKLGSLRISNGTLDLAGAGQYWQTLYITNSGSNTASMSFAKSSDTTFSIAFTGGSGAQWALRYIVGLFPVNPGGV